MEIGPYVASAVRDLGIPLDRRGLVPIAEARKRVRAAKIFAPGKSHVIPNQVSRPTDGDYLWAALLSLDSADEFVREASRIVWKCSPRGFDNLAPYERFGAAIVPWLATFIDARGRLAPNPACAIACLTAIADTPALATLLRIRTKAGVDVRELVRAWLARHGKRGWKALATLAGEGDARANAVLLAEAKRAPAAVRAALGTAKTALRGAPTELEPAAILEVLDDAAASTNDDPLPWPTLRASVGHFECHAVRVIAARAKTGDAWGILFEVVQGDVLAGPRDDVRWPMTIQHYRYGSHVPTGGRYLEDARTIGMHRVLPRGFVREAFAVPASFAGVKVVGPRGSETLVLSDALVKRLDLRPGRACCDRIEDWPSVIAVRARLAREPGALWRDAKRLVKPVLGIADAVVVVDSDAFEHVSGPGFGVGRTDRRLPSATETFRSIAAAIVARDGKQFAAGKPNVGWRNR